MQGLISENSSLWLAGVPYTRIGDGYVVNFRPPPNAVSQSHSLAVLGTRPAKRQQRACRRRSGLIPPLLGSIIISHPSFERPTH